MQEENILNFIKRVLVNMPQDWVNLTTHRLDIYNEEEAKTGFLNLFDELFQNGIADENSLAALPTAYDYIRLGHPLSCVLEWTVGRLNALPEDHVISFSSKVTPILAILRKNLMSSSATRIVYTDYLPPSFDAATVKEVYGYQFDLLKVDALETLPTFDGTTVVITEEAPLWGIPFADNVDFYINMFAELGSVLLANSSIEQSYISEIQHVRRRETISMTPSNCEIVLNHLVNDTPLGADFSSLSNNKQLVIDSVKSITEGHSDVLVASSGLSIQYAIMMGLIHDAMENHPGKAIKFVVPPNCYGGTNDQARRVAACLPNVSVVDLPVDGDNEMVDSVNRVLDQLAKEDAVPYIIAEIPTNPRVEVPNMELLRNALNAERKTAVGAKAIDPVFILDQTFCPNVHFLGDDEILASIRTISYASGSKFPSGGKCTAGYCVSNKKASDLMEKIALHLSLCDNEATALQYEFLAEQLPSMNNRIASAYENTRSFVNFIEEKLPAAKINFVSEELARAGFTPSVFSLDLPTKGITDEEREQYKRSLNLRLINLMISEIPNESKFCVSYGQLKGCYWTIPATSTQGTTKEGDKDYIVRASLSGNMDLEQHKKVFLDFVKSL